MSCLPIQEPRLKIKYGHEPRVGSSHSKETQELREFLKPLQWQKSDQTVLLPEMGASCVYPFESPE